MMRTNLTKTLRSVFLLALCGWSGCQSAAQDTVRLPQPDMDRPATVMQALGQRQSTRAFDGRELAAQDLADLLWAANGVNRPASGKRTAPSALNRQDVDVYVLTARGAYRYDAATHALQPVATDDLRPAAAGGQDFVAAAPAVLVLVSDLSKFGGRGQASALRMGAIDAGIVSQNAALFCAAAGLATVPRASMDADALRTGLKLADEQEPMLNLPVGYFKR